MNRYLISFVLIVLLALAAYANVPLRPDPADVGGFESAKPILTNIFTDDVSWMQMPDAQANRRAGAGAIGDYWYVFGEQTVATAQAFNLQTLQWEASTPPPVGYCNWPGVVADGSLYLVAGYAGSYYNNLQKFTPTGGGPTGTWEQMAPYPLSTCGVAAAWDGDNYLYAAGGTPGYTNAYRYNIANNAWETIASMPVTYRYAGGAFCGGEFHIIGGIETPYTHYAYNPGSNTWSSKAAVPVQLNFATFSVSNDPDMSHMYSIGGGGHGSTSWPATDAVLIYDPTTDSWATETSLPVAYGCNASDYIADGVAMSTGGAESFTSQGATYYGTGFPGGGPPPTYDMTVTLTYVSGSPVPAGGGSIVFDLLVTHNETMGFDFDGWLDIEYEGGAPTTVVLRDMIHFEPGWSINRPNTTIPIPGTYAGGNYMMFGRVGWYPEYVLSGEDSFPFTKEGADITGFQPWVPDGITNPFEVAKNTEVIAPTEFTMAAYPNPFNPTTNLSFTLPEAQRVALTVYDLSGRQVAQLVNGYRAAGAHEVTFDASNLASGVYLYQLNAGDQHASGKIMLLK